LEALLDGRLAAALAAVAVRDEEDEAGGCNSGAARLSDEGDFFSVVLVIEGIFVGDSERWRLWLRREGVVGLDVKIDVEEDFRGSAFRGVGEGEGWSFEDDKGDEEDASRSNAAAGVTSGMVSRGVGWVLEGGVMNSVSSACSSGAGLCRGSGSSATAAAASSVGDFSGMLPRLCR
jgi:hypothetical protein